MTKEETNKNGPNFWREIAKEVVKYSGAVAVIYMIGYLLLSVIPMVRGVDPEVMRIWNQQTKILQNIDSLLVLNYRMNKETAANTDTIVTEIRKTRNANSRAFPGGQRQSE